MMNAAGYDHDINKNENNEKHKLLYKFGFSLTLYKNNKPKAKTQLKQYMQETVNRIM
jgi:hypothetical protein